MEENKNNEKNTNNKDLLQQHIELEQARKKERNKNIFIGLLIMLMVFSAILFTNVLKTIDYSEINMFNKESVVETGNAQPTDTSYITDIYNENKDAVVSVVNLKEITLGQFFGKEDVTNQEIQQSSGSGFVYKYENGKYYALTNYHVVDGSDALQVVLDVNAEEPVVIDATLLGGNKTYDIAVITFETKENITPVVIGDSDEVVVGEPVVAMGSPYGQDFQGSVTSGIVSGPVRTTNVGGIEYNYIQTDAAINHGNSGGPLFNEEGEVIGVNSMKIADGSTDNMAFAIPINDVMEIVEDIEAAAEEVAPILY